MARTAQELDGSSFPEAGDAVTGSLLRTLDDHTKGVSSVGDL